MIFYIALFEIIPYYFLDIATKKLRTFNLSNTHNSHRGWMINPLVYISTCIHNLTYIRLERIKTLINWFPRNVVAIIFLAVRFANKTNLYWWNAVRLEVNDIMELAYKVCFKCIISHFIFFKIIQKHNLCGYLSSTLFNYRPWKK